MQPPTPARRHAPLPPLNGPKGPQLAAVAAASSLHRPELGPGPYPSAGSSSSLPSSRPSSSSSFLLHDLQASPLSGRSTSCSSGDGSINAAAGELLGSLAGRQDSQQAELVVKAMLPIVKRAMVSRNQQVVQASLDSMRRIEQMFGQEAIDRHLESLAESLEKHTKRGGDSRSAALVVKTLLTLCSPDASASLRQRFPEYVATSSA
eukprot:TRINITY_DN9301_c0_g1_i1.p1 TRINITY_DN9301_c0_g1~~TRINITY_DN9301_c0_g1_i1.p1  ORF type:complete len:206 (+),score=35.43 TRINITY_DN9301_c0_g1_i1:67-684(+)